MISLKRITYIGLKNCRGYSEPCKINIPQGENLLIYGENGSGKSSLYKALRDYFTSSREPLYSFQKNRHKQNQKGEITVRFSNFHASSKTRIFDQKEEEYSFTSEKSEHEIEFIKTASLVKGFLDYTDLLKVYLYEEEQPNLFDLIVLHLLGDHIPVQSGGDFKFRDRWEYLKCKLIKKPYTRRDRSHQFALELLSDFETHLRHTLDLIFEELNHLLSHYFDALNLKLGYELKSLDFDYGDNRNQWHIIADLRLKILMAGEKEINDYNLILNEARLSAIAICLYLSSLLTNPSNVNLKILYLDDVFIGLDSGNRLPIINILNEKFSEFQIFISTYDRHWFEIAQQHLSKHDNQQWKSIEIYAGKHDSNELTVPILVWGESNYEKGLKYLHHRSNPDYPAAANYFRKALEEILSDHLPECEKITNDYTPIPNYKLSSLVIAAKSFLYKTDNSTKEIDVIYGLLNILLHPFSHHEPTYPIYKSELIIFESAYRKLKQLFESLNISKKYFCVLTKKNDVCIKIDVTSKHVRYYLFKLDESLLAYRSNNDNRIVLSKSPCTLYKAWGVNNGICLGKHSFKKPYDSLDIAVEATYSHLREKENISISSPETYIDVLGEVQRENKENTWQPLSCRIEKAI